MGDEKIKIAVLGPLGTYTHEASVITNLIKIRLILPFLRQLSRNSATTSCMMNNLQYQVNDLIFIFVTSVCGYCQSL